MACQEQLNLALQTIKKQGTLVFEIFKFFFVKFERCKIPII